MRLSAPVYRLKRQARLLSRRDRVPLHQALDRAAAEEGFASWSLLAAKAAEATPAGSLLAQLAPGDLVLVGARPRQGKTLMSLELAVEAMKSGHRSVFFTLEYTHTDSAGPQAPGFCPRTGTDPGLHLADRPVVRSVPEAVSRP